MQQPQQLRRTASSLCRNISNLLRRRLNAPHRPRRCTSLAPSWIAFSERPTPLHCKTSNNYCPRAIYRRFWLRRSVRNVVDAKQRRLREPSVMPSSMISIASLPDHRRLRLLNCRPRSQRHRKMPPSPNLHRRRNSTSTERYELIRVAVPTTHKQTNHLSGRQSIVNCLANVVRRSRLRIAMAIESMSNPRTTTQMHLKHANRRRNRTGTTR